MPSGYSSRERQAISVSLDDARSWNRGWQVSLFGPDNGFVEKRFVDLEELSEIIELLARPINADAPLGHEYQSRDDVVLTKFGRQQRITLLTRGIGTRTGLSGNSIVEEIVVFLRDSATLWEGD